jgi:hypothetical protein
MSKDATTYQMRMASERFPAVILPYLKGFFVMDLPFPRLLDDRHRCRTRAAGS